MGWSGLFSVYIVLLQVIQEMQEGLKAWETAKRWDSLGITQQVSDSSYNWSCS